MLCPMIAFSDNLKDNATIILFKKECASNNDPMLRQKYCELLKKQIIANKILNAHNKT